MGHISPNFAAIRIANIAVANAVAGEPGVRVTVVRDCSRIVIENLDTNNDVWLQTDPTDSSCYKIISKGLELDLNAKSSGDPIFHAGEVLGYLIPQGGGTGPVCVTFTR